MDDLKQTHRAMLDEATAGLHADVLFSAYRGSIAHGMFVPSTDPDSIDDVDFMTIVMPPLKDYFGLYGWPRKSEIANTPYVGSGGTLEYKVGATDLVAYELRQFFTLLKKGNPNVLTLLWLRPEFIFYESPEWYILRANRDAFVGKHVFESFSGYARQQMRRMLAGDSVGGRGFNGEKRKELRQRYGYDTANAAHMIRLLRMGIEFLDTGALVVERPDADELLAIKRGAWTMDAVEREANRLFAGLESAAERSQLPEEPNGDLIESVCVAVIRNAHRRLGHI